MIRLLSTFVYIYSIHYLLNRKLTPKLTLKCVAFEIGEVVRGIITVGLPSAKVFVFSLTTSPKILLTPKLGSKSDFYPLFQPL